MPSKFFRVDGADQESGEETYLVLQAKTKPQAEQLARDQGLLVAGVREANPDDWAAPQEEPIVFHETAHEEEAPADHHAHEHETHTHEAHAHETHPHEDHEHAHMPEHEPFIEPAPATPHPAHYTIEPGNAHAPETDSASGGSAASAVVLACAGAAIILGGVLALTLALWPDNAVRNDLQQLDYRMHSLVQTVLGSTLVLGGLVILLISVICYVAPRRKN